MLHPVVIAVTKCRINGAISSAIALIVMAVTAAQAVDSYSPPHLQQAKWSRVMTNNTIDRTEGKLDNELTKAERRDELLDSELDMVTGGSFELGNIIGSIAKATLPLA
jgi:hypothetical protein